MYVAIAVLIGYSYMHLGPIGCGTMCGIFFSTANNAHHRTTASEAIEKGDRLKLIPIGKVKCSGGGKREFTFVILAAVIGLVCVVISALLFISVVLIIKKARRKIGETAPEVDIEAEYEVIDHMDVLPPLEQNSNSARASTYSVVENGFPGCPGQIIYAEVDDGITMKLNDAYQLTKQDQKILSTFTNSCLPPRPIADRQRMLNASPPPMGALSGAIS